MQCSSDGSRNADEWLQASETGAYRFADRVGQLYAAADDNMVLADRRLREHVRSQADNHTLYAIVSDEQIRPAAQHANLHFFLTAAAYQSGKFFNRVGLGEEFGGTT